MPVAPIPVPLPAQAATAWYSHYQWLDSVARYVVGLIDNLIPAAQKGQANGVPTLDATGRIPQTQMPKVFLQNYATLAAAQADSANLAVGQIFTVG